MARIRTIKPEFPHSESMGRVSRDARLCFILLWTIADDSGRLRGNSRMLASLLFPYDDDARKCIDGWLDQLAKEGCIVRYEVGGDSYIQVENWNAHQRIDKPSASKLPSLKDDSVRIREDSRGFQEDSEILPVGREGKGREGKEKEHRASATPSLKPQNVDQQVWEDWVKLRKEKKAAITKTALDGIEREAEKAGIGMEDALKACCEFGWQGFNAGWYEQRKPNSHQNNAFAGAL